MVVLPTVVVCQLSGFCLFGLGFVLPDLYFGELRFCVDCSEPIKEHCLSLEELGSQVLQLLALSLGVEKNFYSQHFHNQPNPCGSWGLHHYPPNPSPGIYCRAAGGEDRHSDPSVLKLVRQSGRGLYVPTPAGGTEWIDVEPMEDSFVVIVGDILEVRRIADFYFPYRVGTLCKVVSVWSVWTR